MAKNTSIQTLQRVAVRRTNNTLQVQNVPQNQRFTNRQAIDKVVESINAVLNPNLTDAEKMAKVHEATHAASNCATAGEEIQNIIDNFVRQQNQ